MSSRDKSATKTADEKSKERSETLQKYVSDMMAVEEHIGNAVKRQTKDENVYKHNPQASQIIKQIAKTTERHEQELKRHLEAIGGDPAKGIKEVATAALGTIAGLYDKVRTEALSKMLRDDYTALNLATIGYTMLHTTGLAFNDQATAALALRHLQDYTGIVMEINQIIPSIVVADLRENGALVNESVLQQAIANTQRVWQPSNAGNGNGNSSSNGSSKTKTKATSKSTTTSASKKSKSTTTGAGRVSKKSIA